MMMQTIASGSDGRLMSGYFEIARIREWVIERNEELFKTIHASLLVESVDEYRVNHVTGQLQIRLYLKSMAWCFEVPPLSFGYGFPDKDGKLSSIPYSVDFKIPDSISPKIVEL